MKNCYCLIAFRGGSSGSRTGYPAAISNRSRHAMIHAFKVQRRSAVGRSRSTEDPYGCSFALDIGDRSWTSHESTAYFFPDHQLVQREE